MALDATLIRRDKVGLILGRVLESKCANAPVADAETQLAALEPRLHRVRIYETALGIEGRSTRCNRFVRAPYLQLLSLPPLAHASPLRTA